MKKYKKILYIILILTVVLMGFFIYKIFAKNDSNQSVEEKVFAEIKYIENRIQTLLNQLNNISFENYKISSTEINQGESQNESSSDSEKTKQSGEKEGSEKSNGSGESSDSNTSQEGSEKSENKKYKLEETGILTKDSEIDWNQLKNDIENIYTFLNSMTLDLYQTSTNQEDIANFNREYDNLIKAVKDENKDNSLEILSNLYNYLSEFVENCTNDNKEKIIIKTKNYIFKAYSILEKEEWDIISDNINNAIQEFSSFSANSNNLENVNQYNVNKTYLMINELKNAIDLRDKEVFLIKYKNLLEELQNI